MPCSNSGCGCAKKKSPLANGQLKIERYKTKELLRRLLPLAQDLAKLTHRKMEDVFLTLLKPEVKKAFQWELEALDLKDEEKEEVLKDFEEDFHFALKVILGKEIASKAIQKRIRVCMGPTCKRKGSGILLQNLSEALGLTPNQSKEGVVLETIDCSRNCREGPNIFLGANPLPQLAFEEILDLTQEFLKIEGKKQKSSFFTPT